MVISRLKGSKPMVIVPSLLALAFIIACSGSQATSAPEADGEAPTPHAVTSTAAGVAAATPVPEATRAPAMPAKYGGRIPMHAYSAPVTVQPLIEATYSHLQNLSPLYNGIMMYDPETADPDDLVCDLCTGWDVSGDGRTFTYYLILPESRRQLVRRDAGHR